MPSLKQELPWTTGLSVRAETTNLGGSAPRPYSRRYFPEERKSPKKEKQDFIKTDISVLQMKPSKKGKDNL
jgi:hypothetical protein